MRKTLQRCSLAEVVVGLKRDETRVWESNDTILYLNFHSMFWLLQIVICYRAWQNFWNPKRSVFVTPQFTWVLEMCAIVLMAYSTATLFFPLSFRNKYEHEIWDEFFSIENLKKHIEYSWHTVVFELVFKYQVSASHQQNFFDFIKDLHTQCHISLIWFRAECLVPGSAKKLV